MGLYVSFPTAGLTCGLIFPAAGGVDTVTGSAFVKPDCPDVSFASSTFAGRVSTSWPPSPLRFLATGSLSSARGRRVVSEPPSFGWISLRIPWLVLISSIICRNINGQISQRGGEGGGTRSDVRVMLYLVKFIPILDHRQLDIVIHRKHNIIVEGRLFGRTMESSRIKTKKHRYKNYCHADLANLKAVRSSTTLPGYIWMLEGLLSSQSFVWVENQQTSEKVKGIRRHRRRQEIF